MSVGVRSGRRLGSVRPAWGHCGTPCPGTLLGLLEPPGYSTSGVPASRPGENTQRKRTVKKLIVLAVVALGLAAVWRKVQSDRAELDLWTEATTADE